MTSTHPPSLALPLLGCLLLAACGGDDASPDAGPPPVDQCTDPSDIAIIANIAAMTDGGIPDGGVPDGGPYPTSFNEALGRYMGETCTGSTAPCFQNILSETDVDACLTQCFMGSAAEGLSKGCANCYVELIGCGADYCITSCLSSGQGSTECDACVQAACGARHEACTGLPLLSSP